MISNIYRGLYNLVVLQDLNVINWKSKCHIAQKGKTVKIKVTKIRQKQLEQFDGLLANYNWSPVFSTSAINRKVNTFLQITENIISEHIPEKTVRIYRKDKPFVTHKVKRLILKMNMALKNNKVERVRSLRRQISAEIRKAKTCFYENKVGLNLKNCPKSWWKQIKSLIGKTTVKAILGFK